MEKEYNLESLKSDYRKLQEKHNLPGFDELNEDFVIEKASESESELLIREIRKFIADKLANYLRFIETILNPVNAQMFVFSIIKSLGNEEKEKLTEIYKQLSKNEINLIVLDVRYDEKREAEFIKESFKMWQDIKKDLLEILGKVQANWDNKSEVKNKDYFG